MYYKACLSFHVLQSVRVFRYWNQETRKQVILVPFLLKLFMCYKACVFSLHDRSVIYDECINWNTTYLHLIDELYVIKTSFIRADYTFGTFITECASLVCYYAS